MTPNVLVIDNDPQVRELFCAMLASDGYTAAGVTSYPEAIAYLHKGTVDLALTDGFTALGLAGVSALRRLFPSLRLLVMSGSVSDHASIPFSSRVLSILPKPCPARMLLSVVRGVLWRTTVDPLQEILERGRFDLLMTLHLSPERGVPQVGKALG
jgi:CheY-like chemotaxis protein